MTASPLTQSRWLSRATVLVACLALSSCAGGNVAPDCPRGEATAQAAVEGLVMAVQEEDLAQMQAQVLPRFTVSTDDLEEASAELAGVTLNEMSVYTHAMTPKAHSALVRVDSGEVIARFEVYAVEGEPDGCFAVLAGTADELPPGASITPSSLPY